MNSEEWLDPDQQNDRAFDDLIVAVEASQGVLSLLIAVCEQEDLRDRMIARYEAELGPEIRGYRLRLTREQPSLRHAIATTIAQDDYLSAGGKAVLTVTGATQLGFLRLGQEKSEQEIFFGYLQWTRESLPEFRYPIVLWLTQQLLTQLRKQAPDFWSWRKDVFRFASKKTATVPTAEIMPIFSTLETLEPGINKDDNILLADLQALIAQVEQNQPDDPLLATLYSYMGDILGYWLDRNECLDYPDEIAEAVEYWQKAIALQEIFALEIDAATSLNLAALYRSQGRYAKAEPLFLRSLSIYEQQLGADHPQVSASLSHLAGLYRSQGRYSEAEPLYLQALSIVQQQLGDDHPQVATSLNNLAGLYKSQGRYSEAEPLYVRSLSILKQQLGADHPSTQLGWRNFRYLLQQAIQSGRTAELSDHPTTQSLLQQLQVDG